MATTPFPKDVVLARAEAVVVKLQAEARRMEDDYAAKYRAYCAESDRLGELRFGWRKTRMDPCEIHTKAAEATGYTGFPAYVVACNNDITTLLRVMLVAQAATGDVWLDAIEIKLLGLNETENTTGPSTTTT